MYTRKTMAVIAVIGSLACVMGGLSACKEEKKKSASNKVKPAIAATFKQGKVTVDELKELAARVTGDKDVQLSKLDANTREALVHEIVVRKLVEKEARKVGIAKEPEVKDAIRNFSNQLISQEFLAKQASNAVTEEKIKARYEDLSKELAGKEEFKVRHILLKDEVTAEDIRNKLTSGQNFEALAKQYSQDAGTRNVGGDVGYFVPGQLNKDFEKATQNLKKGEISQPVQTPFGWHIIELVDRRPAKPAPYAQAKDLIAGQLKAAYIQDYLKQLVAQAAISVTVSPAEAGQQKAAEPKAEANAESKAADPKAAAAKAEQKSPAKAN